MVRPRRRTHHALPARASSLVTLLAARLNAPSCDDDGAGRFWHLCTDAFCERFFLKVVQRAGGYAGFGAANTPVRAAAQTRLHPAGALLMQPAVEDPQP